MTDALFPILVIAGINALFVLDWLLPVRPMSATRFSDGFAAFWVQGRFICYIDLR